MSACLYAGVMVGVPFLAVSNIALIVAYSAVHVFGICP